MDHDKLDDQSLTNLDQMKPELSATAGNGSGVDGFSEQQGGLDENGIAGGNDLIGDPLIDGPELEDPDMYPFTDGSSNDDLDDDDIDDDEDDIDLEIDDDDMPVEIPMNSDLPNNPRDVLM